MSVPDDPLSRPARPCTWMKQLVSALADGSLTGATRWMAELHILRCPHCSHALMVLQDLRRRLRALTSAPGETLSADRRRAVEAAWSRLDEEATE